MTRDAGLEGFVKEQFGVLFEIVAKTHKRIDDLQETIGGVEQQVHEIRDGAKESFLTAVQDREIARLREELRGWHFNHEEAIKRAEKAEAGREEFKRKTHEALDDAKVPAAGIFGPGRTDHRMVNRIRHLAADRDAAREQEARALRERDKERTSVMYLRAILCRIAAEDYRGGEPEYIRLAREALKAEEES